MEMRRVANSNGTQRRCDVARPPARPKRIDLGEPKTRFAGGTSIIDSTLSTCQPVMVNATGKPDDVWSEFVVAIFRLNGLIMRAGEGVARPLGQSSARWQVLGRAFEPQTVAAMANDMGHARQSVQRVADALVADGLVVYRVHPTDRRTKVLELTPDGLEVLTAIYHRQLAWSERVVAKLDASQLPLVTEALEGIGATLESEIDSGTERAQKLEHDPLKKKE